MPLPKMPSVIILSATKTALRRRKTYPTAFTRVHQVKGWDGREFLPDFDVYISKDGQTYRYLANNRNFESYIKIVKVDAETGKVIPLAGAGFRLYRPDGSLITQTFTYPEADHHRHLLHEQRGLISLRPKSWNTARAIRWSRFLRPTATR